jgi:colicin import membrane protein
MSKYFFAIFMIAFQAINTLATAQNKELIVEVKSDTKSDVNLDTKLAEIKQTRLAIESSFKTREAECYKNFAVSNCLQKLKSEKLLALSDIKRQELEINDQKRQIKSDAVENKVFEKSKKIAEKELVKEQAQTQTQTQTLLSEPSGAKATKISKTRKTVAAADAPSENDKSKLAEQRALAAKQRVLEANIKQSASQQKAQSRALKFSQSGEQEAKFNQKQLDAQARKSKLEKAAAEKTKPKSASLPIPGSELLKQ